jgi:hypothetical protein
MAKEIERRFLVDTALWRAMAAGTLYRQGYLSSVNERVVRVRIAQRGRRVTFQLCRARDISTLLQHLSVGADVSVPEWLTGAPLTALQLKGYGNVCP